MTQLGEGCANNSGQPGVFYGDIVARRIEPRCIVTAAPERSLVALGVIARADERLLFVTGDTLYIGEDAAGDEVAYRVTGWDADNRALAVERVTAGIAVVDEAAWARATAPLVEHIPSVPVTTPGGAETVESISSAVQVSAGGGEVGPVGGRGVDSPAGSTDSADECDRAVR